MILGQYGSPVMIYAGCKQVGPIDHAHPAFMSPELSFGFLYFVESVHPSKSGANKNFMSFTKQSLAFPYVSLNRFLFSSNSD